MNALSTAIKTKLAADATLAAIVTGGWFVPAAPAGTTYPYGCIQKVSSTDTYALSRWIATTYLYQIRIIGQGPTVASIGTAMARVNVLLTRVALTVTGYKLGLAQRDGDLPDVSGTGADGVPLEQVGATYRFWVTAA